MDDETSTTETGEANGTSESGGGTTSGTTSTETSQEKESTSTGTTAGTQQVTAATQEAKTVVVDSGAIADSVISRIAEKYDLTPKQTEEVKKEAEEKKEPEKKEPEKKASPPSVTPASEHWKNKKIFGRRNRDAA
jgi:hypothetical protein